MKCEKLEKRVICTGYTRTTKVCSVFGGTCDLICEMYDNQLLPVCVHLFYELTVITLSRSCESEPVNRELSEPYVQVLLQHNVA